ncbi:MAG: 50S ribosomal protein L3 [Deltaproteobacteria bacterium]|nr:50S ribosomal protein L3 [Deltaproteobacteria bacterium]
MKERKLGILGKKLGMTQFFDDKGVCYGVTVVQTGPCTVLKKCTKAKTKNDKTDGYTALQLGFEQKPERKVSKPEEGVLKAAGGKAKARRYVVELRVSEETLAKFEVGQEITLKDLGLKAGDYIDVTGISKGKGFQGVMRRHNFAGFPATHGTHEYFRHPGSIGNRKWPGRVMKGRRMPGHMGDRKVTVQNLKVVQLREDDGALLVAGAVPGHKNAYVMVRPAIKSNPLP